MTSRNGARLLGAILTTSALALCVPSAFANGQGTPVEPAPAPAPTTMAPEPAPAPVVTEAPATWQGFYVGLDLGYAFQGSNDHRIQADTGLSGNYLPNFFEADGTTPVFQSFDSDKRNGIDAGIRAGYDWQFDNFVVGALLEADYQNIKNTDTAFTSTDYYSIQRKLDFLGAGRLRAGVLVDPNWLIYATGGVAWGDIKHDFGTSNVANDFTVQNDSKGGWGYQFGGGVETKVSPDLSIGVEYLYTSLDDKDYSVRISHGTATALDPFVLNNPLGTDLQDSKDRFNTQSVRATLTYHFEGT